MPTYRLDEGELEIPSGWTDKTVNVFTVGNSLPLALSFVISREPLDPHKDLAVYADEKLDDFSHQLKEFKIIEKRQIELAGAMALDAEFTWRGQAGLMYQRQTYVGTGNILLVFTATARRELSEEHRATIDAVLTSFRPTDMI